MATKTKSKKSSFGSKLASFKGKWGKASKAAAEERDSFAELEDGTYLMRLSGGEVRLSQSGNLGMSLEFTVVRGENKGSKYFDWTPISNDAKDLKRLARRLQELGVEDPDIEELESIIKDLVKEKTCVRARLKTGEPTDEYPDPRQWFNILKVLDEIDEDDEDDDEDEDRPSKKSKSKKDDDEDEDDEDDDEDEDEDDEDEDDEDDEEDKKSKKSKKSKSKDDDDEDEDDDEDTAELEKGSSVAFKVGKKEVTGTVVKINEDDEEVVVKDDKGKKHTVPADQIELLASEDDDDE